MGGVGVHTATLAAALSARGHRVTRACWGANAPGQPDDGADLLLPGPLEWESERALPALQASVAAGRALLARYAARGPDAAENTVENTAENTIDVLHCNQFAWVGAVPGVPSVVVTHSDVVSWWRAVHSTAPPSNAYHRWYSQLVRQALQQAAAVVAPTQAALADLRASFQWQGAATVIAHGSDSPLAPGSGPRQGAVCAGRLGDAGKQIHLLLRSGPPLAITLAGPLPPGVVGASTGLSGVHFAGPLGRPAMAELLARSCIYVSPSRYEPFGLAPLEAARAGCCLLLNDLPSFREIWGDAAYYFDRNDGDDLRDWLQRLAGDDALVAAGAAAAHRRALALSAARMAGAYEVLYQEARAEVSLPA